MHGAVSTPAPPAPTPPSGSTVFPPKVKHRKDFTFVQENDPKAGEEASDPEIEGIKTQANEASEVKGY